MWGGSDQVGGEEGKLPGEGFFWRIPTIPIQAALLIYSWSTASVQWFSRSWSGYRNIFKFPEAWTMRVGVVALLHESNTFIKEPTHAAHFEGDLLLIGDPLVETLIDTHHEVGGFLTGLREEKIEIVPLVATRAVRTDLGRRLGCIKHPYFSAIRTCG
jgi:hypothetical protein